jgi:cytochrome c oxidase subunit 3
MLFAGFSSAYLIRRTAPDWIPIYAPPVLWFNNAVLLFSSVALEIARTSRKFGKLSAFRGWYLAAVGLGAVFLYGQWAAWGKLAAQGIFLPSSPHGSFFYMLSAVHAVHVVAGMLALCWVLVRRWNSSTPMMSGDPVNLCATYWHFVTGTWVFLYWLLFVWR